ncbi:MAG: VTT domain-containing protein, partial [Anaerolineales bacterium]
NRRSALTVLLVMAIIPNPLFDVVGIAAGALKIRLEQFLVITAVGKIIKMLFFAYAGFYSVDWLAGIF